MIIKESVLKRIIRNILLEGGGDVSIDTVDADREITVDQFKNTVKKKKSILIQNVVKILENCVDENPNMFSSHNTSFFISFIKMLSEKEFLHLTQENEVVDVQNFIYDFYKSIKEEGPTNEKTYLNATQQKYENSALEILLTNWSQFSKFISNTQALKNQTLNKITTIIAKIKQKYRKKEKISFDTSTNDIDYLMSQENKSKKDKIFNNILSMLNNAYKSAKSDRQKQNIKRYLTMIIKDENKIKSDDAQLEKLINHVELFLTRHAQIKDSVKDLSTVNSNENIKHGFDNIKNPSKESFKEPFAY